MKLKSVITLLALFVLFQVVAAMPAAADGLIKYHVKVKNDMSDPPKTFTCTVYVYDGTGNYERETINQGETKTITIKGPHCPKRLEGSCKNDYIPGSTSIHDRCANGKEDSSCIVACHGSGLVHPPPFGPHHPF